MSGNGVSARPVGSTSKASSCWPTLIQDIISIQSQAPSSPASLLLSLLTFKLSSTWQLKHSFFFFFLTFFPTYKSSLGPLYKTGKINRRHKKVKTTIMPSI